MTTTILEKALVTGAWPWTHHYTVELETTGPLYGGMSASKEAYEKMPWATRSEELRKAAAKLTEETVEMEEGPVSLTVFRRVPGTGALALSANQIRSMLQETAAAVYQGKTGYFSLRAGLRRNLLFQPTLLELRQRTWEAFAATVGSGSPDPMDAWGPATEPDGVGYFPRTIRKPPFERSIEANPEYVNPPVLISFDTYVLQEGTGRTLTKAVLRALFDYAGSFIGAGAHRGLDGLGTFQVTRFELVGEQKSGLPPLAR